MNHTPFEVTVANVEHCTTDTIKITFEQPATPLSYKPGQYLTLIVNIDGKEVRRAYSLCSSPYANDMPAVAVKKVENGVLSTWLLANLKAGDKLRLLEPLGHFFADIKPLETKHYVLIGAGSGITPLFSILKSVLIGEPRSLVTLIYGNRSEDNIIFKSELEALQDAHPSRMRVVNCLSKPAGNHNGPVGRIDSSMLVELLEQTEPVVKVDETHYYLCGPEGLMETSQSVLRDKGVKPYLIHKESFFHQINEVARQSALEAAAAAAQVDPTVGREVTIHFEGDTYNVLVKPDETILSAALELDIPLPYSCQAGLCTACRAKCISGKVHMDEMEGLSTSEVNEGYVLCCVSHPLTADVVIDYD